MSTAQPCETPLLEQLKFDANGLLTAIAQDAETGDVLMVAFMNAEAVNKTVATGEVHYWSRSRQELWHKGGTSGHVQKVRSLHIDCDGDALLLKITQEGAACHKGYRNCFFRELDANGALQVTQEKTFDPDEVYKK